MSGIQIRVHPRGELGGRRLEILITPIAAEEQFQGYAIAPWGKNTSFSSFEFSTRG